MNLKRYETNVGYAQLDHVIESLSPSLADGTLDTDLGQQYLLGLIVEKLADGINPARVAADLHIPFPVLWNWLSADPKRMEMYDQGQAMWANKFHAEVIGIADEATVDDVAVAKLRIDTRFKAASNYDKRRFGQSVKVDVNNTHTIDINGLLDARLNRIKEITNQTNQTNQTNIIEHIN